MVWRTAAPKLFHRGIEAVEAVRLVMIFNCHFLFVYYQSNKAP
jgi:hypothetical protein